MRKLPMTVTDDMGNNEMIRKSLQDFGVQWRRLASATVDGLALEGASQKFFENLHIIY